MTILCIREDDGMQFQTILNFPLLFKVGEMSSAFMIASSC